MLVALWDRDRIDLPEGPGRGQIVFNGLAREMRPSVNLETSRRPDRSRAETPKGYIVVIGFESVRESACVVLLACARE
jgi:hypothetical protein